MRLLWIIRLVLPFVLAVIGLAAFIESFSFPPLARYFPLGVSAALFVFSTATFVVQFVQLLRTRAQRLHGAVVNDTTGLLAAALDESGEPGLQRMSRRIGLSFGVFALAIGSIAVFGAVVGSALFVAFCQWRLVRARWYVVIVSAVLTGAAIWLISSQFRLIQPHGLLGLGLGLR